MSHRADRRRKYNTTNCLLSPLSSTSTSVSLHRHRLKYVFPPAGLGRGTASHETPGIGGGGGQRGRKGEKAGRLAWNKRERVLRLALSRGGGAVEVVGGGGFGPLTWGNICCVEMETDDSNYVQSQALPGEDGGRNGGEFEATASIRPPAHSGKKKKGAGELQGATRDLFPAS